MTPPAQVPAVMTALEAARRLHAANERAIAGHEPGHDFDVSLECNPGWLAMGEEVLLILRSNIELATSELRSSNVAMAKRLTEVMDQSNRQQGELSELRIGYERASASLKVHVLNRQRLTTYLEEHHPAACDQWGNQEDVALRVLEELRASNVAIAKRLTEVMDQSNRQQGRLSELESELAAATNKRDILAIIVENVRTDRDHVWFWQGDGGDCPETLSCPVVMSADTLRAMLSELAAARADQPKTNT